MTYEEFKAYFITFCWRDGDTPFANNVPMFVQLGEAQLNRDVELEDRSVYAHATAGSNRVPLPPDYHSILDVSAPEVTRTGYRHMKQLTPAQIVEYRAKSEELNFAPYYAIQGNNLLLSGVTATSPIVLDLMYYARLPKLVTEGSSWLLDMHFDLYLYACLMHTATYLREDPRLPVWRSEYARALESVNMSNRYRKWSEGPGEMLLPGIVA